MGYDEKVQHMYKYSHRMSTERQDVAETTFEGMMTEKPHIGSFYQPQAE